MLTPRPPWQKTWCPTSSTQKHPANSPCSASWKPQSSSNKQNHCKQRSAGPRRKPSWTSCTTRNTVWPKHTASFAATTTASRLVSWPWPTGTVTALPRLMRSCAKLGYQSFMVDATTNFFCKYRDLLYRGKQARVPEITGERLQAELWNSAATAANWGQWEHDAWAALPLHAVDWLARMLRHIEAGAPWPTPTKWGKAVCLAMVEGFTTNTRDFRILLILSRLYRR